MTPIALLHPALNNKIVDSFCHISPELTTRSQITETASAALIFGGDGTVHRYLPELSRYKIPALVVPKGSGNDFAKAVGIRDERIALAAWKTFCGTGNNVHEIDLGLIRTEGGKQETLFCCVVACGLDAATNARANRMPGWLRSHGGYMIAAVQSLALAKPARMKLAIAEQQVEREIFLAAIGNAHRYGSGAKIVPRAKLDDGLLDACVVGAMSKLKVLFWLPTIFFGQHLRIRQVEYLQASSLRLETEPAMEIYADGEAAGLTPAEFAIIPRALRVIVPG